MALCLYGRLSSRPILASISRIPSITTAQYAQAASGTPKITFKKFEASKLEHHDDKNLRLSRPLSPHLTIYYFPLPAVLSITHRASGILLSSYITAIGLGALVLPNDVSHYITMIEGLNLSPACLFMIKAILAAPFGYHFANGMRHLYWDTARGLAIKDVYKTGYAMLGISAVITLFLAAL